MAKLQIAPVGSRSLAALQRSISGALMRPLTAEEKMSAVNSSAAEKLIKPNDRLTAFERLQIYNQQYWWRLLGAFAEDFRGVRAVIGERKFDALAQAYLAAHPSTSWTLRNLGNRLPAFLEEHPDLTRPKSALAMDVARVEWARVVAFDGEERPILDPQKIAKIPPARLRLELQPYVTLLELSHPVDTLMKTLKQSPPGGGVASNAVSAKCSRARATHSVPRSRTPIHLAVHRVDFSVYYKRLEPEAYRLLCALRDGATLETACDAAFIGSKDLPEHCAARLREWFARWMEFGWFCQHRAASRFPLAVAAPRHFTDAPPHDAMSDDPSIYQITTRQPGPPGALPLTDELLRTSPSGDIFGLTQNVGMGWEPALANDRAFLILSTAGGLRAPDGRPIALGFHTGHWEIALQVEAAARELRALGAVPFAGSVSDPCDGRTQGTTGMFDSLPYRNDAAIVFRRLIRSLPRRRGVIGVATCDKGLPAMMIALAGMRDLPGIIVPGGVTLPPSDGEDAGAVQTIGARYSRGILTLSEAAELGCRACATPGGGCQFLGTAATSQVVAEALGIALPHSALAPSGQSVWLDIATRSARAIDLLDRRGVKMRDVLTPAAIRNAMIVHAAFGGSTNLLLHVPAIAHAAGLARPRVDDWIDVNRRTPRLVDVLPNGPTHHPTVRVFLAGGVPEVMLHLRQLGLLDTDVLTVTGATLGENLDAWETSERRRRFREILAERDGVAADDVILPPDRAQSRGLTGTLVFPIGNLCPEGSVIKATAVDPSVVGPGGIYRKEGPARVFTSESAAIAAIREGRIAAGDVMVIAGIGPMGTGMEETYQVTSALKALPFGKEVALLTDARFSGVSTGACIGHIGPEALAGGPLGKLRDGDTICITIDRAKMEGRVDFVGEDGRRLEPAEGELVLCSRASRYDLAPHPALPDDTRLWAALQQLGGGTWGGCVYDPDAILAALAKAR